MEDLQQAAYEGLVKAVNRWDSSHGRPLLTYAVPTIRGELQRHFRDHGWTVRPPRRVQELQYALSLAVEELEQRLGRSPRPSEIAAHLSVPREDVEEALTATTCFTPVSLDAPVRAAGADAGDRDLTVLDSLPVVEGAFGSAEARAVLADSLRSLSARERRILELRFFEQRTQQEIADEIGVTQMQVSRLLRRIIADLRGRLAPQVAS
jgi:RNA polymerase sigma-B factor